MPDGSGFKDFEKKKCWRSDEKHDFGDTFKSSNIQCMYYLH